MKADNFLEQKGLEFEVVEQENPTVGCDEAAKERGLETNQIVKSLIIKSEGDFFHCLVPGDRKLSEKKFGQEYRMADPEKSREITGQESGTVHPLASKIKHFVDQRFFEKERISFTRGDKLNGVVLDSETFRKALELADFEWEKDDLVKVTEKEVKELEEKGLSEQDAKFIARNAKSEFEALNVEYEPKRVATVLKKLSREACEPEIQDISEILERAESETHIQSMAKKLAENGELPDETEFDLEKTVDKVLENNSDAVKDFEEGRDSAINYLLGRVMSETNGRAEALKTEKILRDEME